MAYDLENPPALDDKWSILRWLQRLTTFVKTFYNAVGVTSAYTVQDNIYYVRVDASGGAVTITLPDAGKNIGRVVRVCKIDSSGNAVTTQRSGTDLINSSTGHTLAAQWDQAEYLASASGSWTTQITVTGVPAAHTHAEADVTSLVADLAGKAASSHTHTEADVTSLVADLAGKAASSHTHAEADVTGLVADLAGKAATSHSHAESDITNLTTDLAAKVTANGAITGATKTKITYDTKGLVTSGADATTADIADSSNKRYVTDAQLVVVGNTSGTNTGDQTISDATISTTDITTNNASTTKHGFLKKLDNDATHYMDGTGVWSAPPTVSHTHPESDITNLTSDLTAKVTGNVAITGATKTKITYDTKGLVTSGADATTADIADSSNKRYVTDAQLTVIGNTSGTNTGDQTISDATVTFTDITTNNSSTTKHGFLKKLDNTATHYMDGTGAWSTPAATVPDMVFIKLVSAADATITAGYGAYIPADYEIGNTFATEIGDGSVLELG